jgi:hypothetical protein
VERAFVESVECCGLVVDRMYEGLLHREAEPEGRAFWVDRLLDGDDTAETMTVRFVTSAEYIDRALEELMAS